MWNIKSILLSERNLPKEAVYFMIPMTLWKKKTVVIVKGSVVVRGYEAVREGWVGGEEDFLDPEAILYDTIVMEICHDASFKIHGMCITKSESWCKLQKFS